eukprot:371699-Pelagomonas_calceolata.AAC.4
MEILKSLRQGMKSHCSYSSTSGMLSPMMSQVVDAVVGHERLKRFDVILAGDDVTKKKPDPLIYNMARERLGIVADKLHPVSKSPMKGEVDASKDVLGGNCPCRVCDGLHRVHSRALADAWSLRTACCAQLPKGFWPLQVQGHSETCHLFPDHPHGPPFHSLLITALLPAVVGAFSLAAAATATAASCKFRGAAAEGSEAGAGCS